MKPSTIAITSSLTTIGVLVLLVVGGAAVAHQQIDRNFRGGCADIDDAHITSHADEMNGWVADELALDDAQRASLEDATRTLTGWAQTSRDLCGGEFANATASVAALSAFASAGAETMASFEEAFGVFYAGLDANQQAQVDTWMKWPHDHESGFHGHRFSHQDSDDS
jgi:hypothetical protein